MLRSVKAERAKEVASRADAAQAVLEKAADALHAQFRSVPINLPKSPAELPCAELRKATLQCYQGPGAANPAACASQVDAFAACARNVSKIRS